MGVQGLFGLHPTDRWVAKGEDSGAQVAIYNTTSGAYKDFSHIRFVGYVGCQTALTDPTYGNLLDESVNAEAECALGFQEEIYYGNPDGGPLLYWNKWFWHFATGQDDNEPDPVSEACWKAASRIYKEFRDFYGLDSYLIKPEDKAGITLVPAK